MPKKKHKHVFKRAGLQWAMEGSSTPFTSGEALVCTCGKFKDRKSKLTRSQFGI